MSKVQRRSDICLNCETPLRPEDNYCPNCGQKNDSHKIPVKHLFVEFIEDLFHFDTKLWNTLKASFTKPGKITLDYLEGKRARYVPPVKFYVFVSFIFFLLLGKLSDHAVDSGNRVFKNDRGSNSKSVTINELQGNKRKYHSKNPNDVGQVEFEYTSKDSLKKTLSHLKSASDKELNQMLREEDLDTTAQNREALKKYTAYIPENVLANADKPTYNIYGKIKFSNKEEYDQFRENIHLYTDEQVDSLLKAKGERVNWFNRQMLKKLGKFDMKNKDDLKEVSHAIIKSISLTMFLMMPLTAILLLFLFYRKKYYYEHLIFSIHTHTIFFLIFSFILAIQIFISDKVGQKLWGWSILVCFIYLITSLKHNYKQSWSKTIFKFLLMSIPYFFISLILVLVAVVYGFLA
ncbi:MAG: DUF3667 domain-containing protein [Bacteroidetes bacterium]|nr:DUF3667 domain-containing protein [Bacteroidota bacterium]